MESILRNFYLHSPLIKNKLRNKIIIKETKTRTMFRLLVRLVQQLQNEPCQNSDMHNHVTNLALHHHDITANDDITNAARESHVF